MYIYTYMYIYNINRDRLGPSSFSLQAQANRAPKQINKQLEFRGHNWGAGAETSMYVLTMY